MRTKKIRGHRRRWKNIEQWIEANKKLDLETLRSNQRNNVKIHIRPWSGISLTNSRIPEPKRETKNRMLMGLITVYDSWKKQLDTMGVPYYLKIWLFEPRFSKSQVVCALGEYLNFYEHMFHMPKESKMTKPQSFGTLTNEISKFNWTFALDEDHFDNSYLKSDVLDSYKRWMSQLLKKPHRTTKFKQGIGDVTESYSFKRGHVWLGEKSM